MTPIHKTLSIACANCGGEFESAVHPIIDGQDFIMKAAFIQDELNILECPHCKETLQPLTLLYYVDREKSLAYLLLPAELNLSESEQKEESDALIALALAWVEESGAPASLKEMVAQPTIFNDYEAMSQAVLAADGITPEMVARQRENAQLIQELLSLPAESAAFKEMVVQHRIQFDSAFFELLTAYIQTAQEQADDAQVKPFLDLRTHLGQASPQYRDTIAKIDAKLGLIIIQDRADLIEKLLRAPDLNARRDLVAAGFDLIDTEFFKQLSTKLERAATRHDLAAEKAIKGLKNDVLQLKMAHEQESQAVLQSAEDLFKEVIQADAPDQILRQKADQLNETFFFVLGTNIAKARQKGQEGPAQALEMIGQVAAGVLQEKVSNK